MTPFPTIDKTIFPYTHQAVRDLAWLIGSPPLMQLPDMICVTDAFCIEAYRRFETQLATLDKDPAPLLSFLQTSAHKRLGRYAESLMQFWLQHDSDHLVHAANLPIRQGHQTIGEFDILAEIKGLHTGIMHMEMAVKFYLGYAKSAEWHHWIGPNGDDRLDRKLSKLVEQQLVLASHPSAKLKLQELYIGQVTPVLFTKGYFFYAHTDFITGYCIPPHHAAPTHAKGWWCKMSECEHVVSFEPYWTVIPKSEWLSPVMTTGPILSAKALSIWLSTHFEQHSYAILVAAMEKDGEGFKEKHRGFIVRDSWPN